MTNSFSTLLYIIILTQTGLIMWLIFTKRLLKKSKGNCLKDRNHIELKFLRSQINNHFLFNKLNDIYGLARKNSNNTSPMIMKLANIFRNILSCSDKNFAAINSEIQILEDFLCLERLHFENKKQISFIKQIDREGYKIAPMILLTLVENAFKYFSIDDCINEYITMSLKIKTNKLSFNIINSKKPSPNTRVTFNIGLTNIKRQLELLYKEYKIEILNEIDSFNILLFINLKLYEKV